MAHEKIKRPQKPDELAHAVMTQTPGEAAEFFKSLGEVDLTARALGLACRYRGLEMVKTLVKGGAEFRYDLGKIRLLWNDNNRVSELEEGMDFAVALLGSLGSCVLNYFSIMGDQYNRKILPLEERLVILDYLCENVKKTGLDMDDLLFLAYFSNERVIAERLREKGANIPEMWAKIVTEGGWDDYSKSKWFDYCFMMQKLSDEDFIPCISAVVSELGGRKLHYTEWLRTSGIEKRQNVPGFYKFLVESFDLSKVNKGKLMKSMILHDSIDGLSAAAELGWLKQPKKRDEMIAFATEKGMTECTAWLLDFKNRTADLAAERARAEKKAQRELNADPNSLTELKKIWNFEKRGDGTVIITGYKGNKTEITVPEKICGDTVTAVGEQAFSPDQKRIKAEQREFRKTITEIKLPDTITEIGEFAFSGCKSLTEFEIPPKLAELPKGMFDRSGLKKIVVGGNIKKIGEGAFYWCLGLEDAVLCEGIEEIAEMTFYNCELLKTLELPRSVKKLPVIMLNARYGTTVFLHKGSYVEQYYIENKLPFKYI